MLCSDDCFALHITINIFNLSLMLRIQHDPAMFNFSKIIHDVSFVIMFCVHTKYFLKNHELGGDCFENTMVPKISFFPRCTNPNFSYVDTATVLSLSTLKTIGKWVPV
jgi:hypothetical protein